MEINYLITEDEYVRAGKLAMKPSLKQRIYHVLILAALVALGIFSNIKEPAIVAILFSVFLGTLLSRHVGTPWQLRRQYRTYRIISEPAIIMLEELGLRFRNADYNGLLKWQNLLKWRENKEFLLLYQTSHLYQIIPKRLGGNGLDIPSVIAKLEANIGRST